MRSISTPAAHVKFVLPITTTDQQCRIILGRRAAGEFPDNLARRLIAEELHRSNIAYVVAGEKTAQSPQVLRDLTDEMQSLLFQKTIQTTKGGFDPDYMDGNSSTTAWARQLLRAARPSIMRNLANRADKTDLVDPIAAVQHLGADAPEPASYTIFHSAVAAGGGDAETDERKKQDAADWLRSKTRHLRDNSKLAAQAATICYGYDVPSLIRPMLDERRRLKALVDADPAMAHRSVRHMLSVVERHSDVARTDIDYGLKALWDDFTADNLAVIAGAHPKIALALVDHILSDRARPSRNVLRSFRASVRALGSGKGWNVVAEELCKVFIALEFEAYSSFDSTATAFREERVAGRRIDCQKAPDVFSRAVSHPGHPAGRSTDDLYAQLDRFIRNLTDLEVKAPDGQGA